ncbi:unnamed protein product, partial [marine sediment metagenome]
MRNKRFFPFLLVFVCFVASFILAAQDLPTNEKDEAKLLERLHSITSHKLFDYVKELASEKYAGRLTGTEEYKA